MSRIKVFTITLSLLLSTSLIKENYPYAMETQSNECVISIQVDAETQYNLGLRYLAGKSVPQNDAMAFQCFYKAAEQGYAEAQNKLGEMFLYERGLCFRDQLTPTPRAGWWFKKAAEQGHGQAQDYLGYMYTEGLGYLPQDYQQAIYWLEEAVNNGWILSEYHLGEHYLKMKSTDQEEQQKIDQKAAYWFEWQAFRGHRNAQYILAKMFLEGKGVDQNDQLAVFWFHKAAKQGHLEAQNILGEIYREGKGVSQNDQPKNDRQAVHWFQKAAKQGHRDAQTNLEMMYDNERGVGPNNQHTSETS